MKSYSLTELNTEGEEAFVERLGWVFEHSPWVARRAFASAPFASLQAMHDTMMGVVRRAAAADRLSLLRAHPDLASRMAMTEASVQEQRGAGLTELTPEEFESFSLSNRAYTERFGFPFILAVRGHTKQSIYESLILRLGNTPEEELETALLEIGKITYYRLDALVEQETTPDGQQTEGDGCA